MHLFFKLLCAEQIGSHAPDPGGPRLRGVPDFGACVAHLLVSVWYSAHRLCCIERPFAL